MARRRRAWESRFLIGLYHDLIPHAAAGRRRRENEDFLQKPPGLVANSGTVLRVVVSLSGLQSDVITEYTSQDIAPGTSSPMHRTVSLDYGVVIMGEIELALDSGEKRLMKPGDVCIQRGTMHLWRNMSQTEWGRMLYVLQPSKPIEVGGQVLKEDYGTMVGVRSSS